MNIIDKKEVWIGVIGIVPKVETTILGNNGAYTNLILIAGNKAEYIEKANLYCEINNFQLLEVEDVEPVSLRKRRFSLSEGILGVVDDVIKNEQPQITTLHVFKL